MKILAVLLIFVWTAIASTIVLEIYYVKDEEITKTAPVLGSFDYKVTSLCKDSYKYTIIRSYSGDVSSTQDLEPAGYGNIPIRCKSEK